MPDTISSGLADALASPGLIWLILAMGAAGLVRGFAGFGTALIFMPIATHLLPLPVAIVVLSFTDLTTVPSLVPRALRDADKRAVLLMGVAAVAAMTPGIWLLNVVDEAVLRWAVCGIVALTLLALISGWRYTGPQGRGLLAALGLAAGLMGGSTGLAGPPVILFYLAGAAAAASVRANTILFLGLIDVGIIAMLWINDLVTAQALWLSAVLAVPFVLGSLAGQALFRPGREKLFRGIAYTTIALAAVVGLPIFE